MNNMSDPSSYSGAASPRCPPNHDIIANDNSSTAGKSTSSSSPSKPLSTPASPSSSEKDDLKIYLGRSIGLFKKGKGNLLYRKIIDANRKKYQDAIGTQLKSTIANEIICYLTKSLRATFLVPNDGVGPRWTNASDDKVTATVKQALRHKDKKRKASAAAAAVHKKTLATTGCCGSSTIDIIDKRVFIGIKMGNITTQAIKWNIDQYVKTFANDNTSTESATDPTELPARTAYDHDAMKHKALFSCSQRLSMSTSSQESLLGTTTTGFIQLEMDLLKENNISRVNSNEWESLMSLLIN